MHQRPSCTRLSISVDCITLCVIFDGLIANKFKEMKPASLTKHKDSMIATENTCHLDLEKAKYWIETDAIFYNKDVIRAS